MGQTPDASPVQQLRAAADSALHRPTAPSAGQAVQLPLTPSSSEAEGQSDDDENEDEEDILSPEEYAAEMQANRLLIADVPAGFQSTMQRTPRAVLQRKLEWLARRQAQLHERFDVMNQPSNLLAVDAADRHAVVEALAKGIDQIAAAEWLLDQV